MPSCPPLRNILTVLANIDHVNSTLGAHKLKASEALLELALDKDHDKIERRKCATAILRAPFQRYPSAAAINGPTPPKPKRRKNDDDDDRDGGGGDDGGDGGDDQPPSAPEDLMRAYDHGYWNGYATFPWEKATRDTIEETVENYAAHAPGRKTPLPSGPDRIAPDRSKPGVITPPLAPSGTRETNHSQAPVASTLKEAPAQAGAHAAQPHHPSPRATTLAFTSPKRQRGGSTRTQPRCRRTDSVFRVRATRSPCHRSPVLRRSVRNSPARSPCHNTPLYEPEAPARGFNATHTFLRRARAPNAVIPAQHVPDSDELCPLAGCRVAARPNLM